MDWTAFAIALLVVFLLLLCASFLILNWSLVRREETSVHLDEEQGTDQQSAPCRPYPQSMNAPSPQIAPDHFDKALEHQEFSPKISCVENKEKVSVPVTSFRSTPASEAKQVSQVEHGALVQRYHDRFQEQDRAPQENLNESRNGYRYGASAANIPISELNPPRAIREYLYHTDQKAQQQRPQGTFGREPCEYRFRNGALRDNQNEYDYVRKTDNDPIPRNFESVQPLQCMVCNQAVSALRCDEHWNGRGHPNDTPLNQRFRASHSRKASLTNSHQSFSTKSAENDGFRRPYHPKEKIPMGTVPVGTVPEMAELDRVNIADIEGEYRRNRRERWRAEAQIAANPNRWTNEVNGRENWDRGDGAIRGVNEIMPSYYDTQPQGWRA